MSPPDEARIKQLNTAHGALQSAGIDLTQPSFSMFAIRSGADPLLNSLLSSGPALAAFVATVPGARYVDKRRARKHALTLRFMAAHRAFYLLLALVPFLPQGWRVPAFVLVVSLMNLPGAIANTAWQSYIADITPADKRPAFLAARTRAMNVVGTLVILGAGAFLDSAPFPLGYQICFALAFLVAGAELAVFARIRPRPSGAAEGECAGGEGAEVSAEASAEATAEASATKSGEGSPPISGTMDVTAESSRASRSRRSPLATARAHMRILGTRRDFLAFLAAAVAFYFAWQTPWSLFSMYTIDELSVSNLWNGVLTVINTGGSLLGFGFWARVSARKGNLFVVFHSALPLVVVPFVYAFSTDIVPIAVTTLFIGMTLSGLVIALFNAMIERTPEAERTTFIAYFNTATMLTAFIAPFWGVALLGFLGYQGAFIVCGLQRLAGACALLALLVATRKRGGS